MGSVGRDNCMSGVVEDPQATEGYESLQTTQIWMYSKFFVVFDVCVSECALVLIYTRKRCPHTPKFRSRINSEL